MKKNKLIYTREYFVKQGKRGGKSRVNPRLCTPEEGRKMALSKKKLHAENQRIAEQKKAKRKQRAMRTKNALASQGG